MRKIDKETLNAVTYWKNWKSGNTLVMVESEPNIGRSCFVFLHGNLIYKKFQANNGEEMQLFTLAGYNTQTTRRRLKAIGVNVSQKKGVPFWGNMEISEKDWYMF